MTIKTEIDTRTEQKKECVSLVEHKPHHPHHVKVSQRGLAKAETARNQMKSFFKSGFSTEWDRHLFVRDTTQYNGELLLLPCWSFRQLVVFFYWHDVMMSRCNDRCQAVRLAGQLSVQSWLKLQRCDFLSDTRNVTNVIFCMMALHLFGSAVHCGKNAGLKSYIQTLRENLLVVRQID